jgi:hypothetical protein
MIAGCTPFQDEDEVSQLEKIVTCDFQFNQLVQEIIYWWIIFKDYEVLTLPSGLVQQKRREGN